MSWPGSSRWSARVGTLAVLACASAFSLTIYSSPARAQSEEELARARDLFRQGLSLEAAGNWAGALAKFEEVGRVKLTPQVRFHIARSHENLGRLNEALGEYRLAEYEASQQQIPEVEEITRAREQLEARVPKLTITRGPGAEAARISLDGVDLGERQIGQPLSVDPGPHSIVARYSGDRQFEQRVRLEERESKAVELVPPEGFEASASPVEAAPGAGASAAGRDAGDRRGPNVLPWVVGGIGAASLVGSGVFFLLRNGAESDLEDTCRGSVCPESARDTQDKGELYTTLSMVTLGVGVVGLGVGTYLLLTDDSRDAAAEGGSARLRRRGWASPRFDVGVSPSGIRVKGAF